MYGFTDKKLEDGEEEEGSSSSYSPPRIKKEVHQYYNGVGSEDRIVGFDDHVKRLASVLVEDDSKWQGACICGPCGVGKTTLAKMVYRDKAVRDHFADGRAWLYVSGQPPQPRRKIWERILDSLGYDGQPPGSKHDDLDWVVKLHNFLKHRKFLVVLDNVGSSFPWEQTEATFFLGGESRSKILLTTGLHWSAGARGLAAVLEYELHELDDYHSRSLLQNYGDDIIPRWNWLRSCKGLPLVIDVLGRTLAQKRSFAYWEMVHKTQMRRSRERIEDVLHICYNDLPYYLKRCFLYLSHFPKGYEISAIKLIQLWITEGIVMKPHEERGKPIEDVAESYLMELAERGMIQVGEVDASLKIKTCYMHDLIRDFGLKKAIRGKFFCIVGKEFERFRGPQSHRRIAIHEVFDIQRLKFPELWCLLFYCDIFEEGWIASFLGQSAELYLRENKAWLSTVWLLCLVMRILGRKLRYVFRKFKQLRVLDFEGANMYMEGRCLKDIDNLKNLKYLCLKNTTCVTKLPSSLGNLRWLQTLDLRMKEFPVHVPDVIWRLERLRHLYLPDPCSSKTKLKLGNLRNLLILVNFNTRNCHLGDLHGLTNLRELSITRYFEVKQDEEGINLSLGIQSLFIAGPEPIDPAHITRLLSHCEKICELGLSAEIGKLPGFLPPSIAYMYLRDSKLDADPMPELEKLPKLRVLEIQNAFTTDVKKIVCSAGGFTQLESLKLAGLPNLEGWEKEEGAMPKLREDSEQIINCKRLEILYGSASVAKPKRSKEKGIANSID